MKKLYKQQNFYLAKEDLESLSSALSQSYADGFGVNLEEGANLPRRQDILSVTAKLEELLFPGFDGEERYRLDTINYRAGKLIDAARQMLIRQRGVEGLSPEAVAQLAEDDTPQQLLMSAFRKYRR